jgi:hypothetical protein
LEGNRFDGGWRETRFAEGLHEQTLGFCEREFAALCIEAVQYNGRHRSPVPRPAEVEREHGLLVFDAAQPADGALVVAGDQSRT